MFPPALSDSKSRVDKKCINYTEAYDLVLGPLCYFTLLRVKYDDTVKSWNRSQCIRRINRKIQTVLQYNNIYCNDRYKNVQITYGLAITRITCPLRSSKRVCSRMSVRSAMDSTTFLVILFWVCLAAATAAVAEPVTRRDGVDNANALNAMRRERWKASIRSFFPWSRASKSNKSSAGDRDKGEKPAAEPKSPRGGGSYAKDNGYGGQDKPQTYATDGVAAYGTEGECLLANNDRPCVCFTADFLDPIGDQTASDESAASRCPSYKPAPKWFAVTRGTAIDGVVDDEDATNDDGTAAAVTAAAARARRVVDFDRVVDYRLKTSKDGRPIPRLFSMRFS